MVAVMWVSLNTSHSNLLNHAVHKEDVITSDLPVIYKSPIDIGICHDNQANRHIGKNIFL
jgi:hypothetical protein